MSFTYTSGATNTPYTMTFNENTERDILVVGGGGGGGRRGGGGGGAGACIYHKNRILNGNYNITVGKGGSGTSTSSSNGKTSGSNGENTQFIKNDGTGKYLAIGGGGGHGSALPTNKTGGSGGGLNYGSLRTPTTSLLTTNNFFHNSAVGIVGGSSYNNSGLVSPEGCRGNLGGQQIQDWKGGGGGGAGSVGKNHGIESSTDDGYGGDGLEIDITDVNGISCWRR